MRRQFSVVTVVAMLVLTAFASVPVAAAESVTVETEAPTNVTTSSATFHGNVTALEDTENVSVWFEYWEAGNTSTTSQTTEFEVTGPVSFSITESGLDSNTTYVVVAHAETESGNASAVGNEVNFTTDEVDTLEVTTDEATELTANNATLNGELTDLAGAENATVWFEWWEEGDAANSSQTPTLTLGSTGSFATSLTGLSNGTTYVFAAHASTANESANGSEVAFTTLDRFDPLNVETLAASDVDNTSATLNGKLTGLDGAASAEVWFEYWVKGDSGNTTTIAMQTLTGPGSFSAGVSGLQNDTTYVYVAHAQANGSNVTGDPVEFTPGAADGDEELVWDGEGPFGQWLTSVLKNLVPADGQPLGQLVSEIVVANNPGSEHRSENAKAGGNGQGPPEDAGKPDDAGPPEDKGKPDDAGPPEDKGKPDDAGPPDDDEDDDEEDGNTTTTSGNGQGNGSGNGNNGGGNGNSGGGNGNSGGNGGSDNGKAKGKNG